MPDTHFIAALSLGFLLGARHALDADHLAAVSTLVAVRPDVRISGWIGCAWGFGHTAMLLLVGLGVLLFKVTIPVPVGRALEFGVGLMLIVLGVSLARSLYREGWHFHPHAHTHAHTHVHEGKPHAHLHSHRFGTDHGHPHWLHRSMKPFAIGMVHGLAGSAALLLLVLSAVRTFWEGMAYILAFGIGSIVGMAVLGIIIALPLVYSASLGRKAQLTLQGLASAGSTGLGLAMMLGFAPGGSPF